MASAKHIEAVNPEPLDLEKIDIEPMSDGGDYPAGRIVHDERGNAVWKWYGDTSSDDTDTTSGVLKYIDPADLEVNGRGDTPGPMSPKSTVPDAGGGYDPYNQSGALNKSRAPVKSGRGKG
jgi:hypothetical protein